MTHRPIAIAAALVTVLVLPATAPAHAQLITAVPADGATVAQAPSQVRLAFSEPVVASRSTLDLYGSDGRRLRLTPRLQGATLTAAVPELADGTYRLVWRSLSADDLHVVGGEVVFGAGAATVPPPPGISTEPQPRVDESALRWAGLALLALLTGSLVLRALGAPPLRRIERLAAGGAVAGAAALVALQAATAGSLSVVLRSGAGHAALTMVAGVLVAVALARRRPRLAVIAATTAAAGLALGSHAAALGTVPMLTIAVHLGCASLWAGTVVAAAIAVRRQAAAGLLRRLAPVLAPAVVGLAATGLLALGRHVVNVDALLTSTYGQVILAKTGLLLAAGAMAIAGRAALTAGRPGRVRRSIAVEATLLLLALGGAALLAAGAPARGPQFAPPAQAAASVIETRQLDDLIVSVEVKPNRPGPNFVAIRVIDTRRPAPAPIAAVRLIAPGIAGDARVSGENEWQVAGVDIARPGALSLRVDVDRPGLPVSTAVRWTVGGGPPPSASFLSRARLDPATTPLALVLLALAIFAVAGHRRRTRTAAVLVTLLAFPGAALAAGDASESVIVQLRGAPAVTQPFGTTPSGRGAAVARSLETDLQRRGRSLREALAGRASAVRPLWIVGGFAVTAPRPVIDAIRRRPDVASVTPDATGLRPAAEPGIDLVGAPPVWSHPGADVLAGTRGAGVTVALLDTGLDVGGQLAARYRGGDHDWLDAYGRYGSPVDAAGPCSGHGTGVGGVIVGGADDASLAFGVAPDARLIAARIFDDTCRASASAVHAAFQWVLDPDGDPDTADAPAVVNASWGEPAVSCQTAFQPDLAALRAAGILVVFAAGNATVPSSPAALPEALAVGALDASGSAALPESGRGTSPCDGRTFPDLAAPGADVRTADRAGGWQTVSGTSIAAPHVSGVLALLLARHPGLLPAEQTAAVMATAHGLVAPGTGAGRVDALAAFESALAAPRDRTAPIFAAPAVSPSIAAASPVTLRATVTDAVPGAPLTGTIAGVTLAVDAGPAVPVAVGAGGAIAVAIDLRALVDGPHVAVLSATDDAANVSRPRSVPFTVDRIAPALSDIAATRDDAGRVLGTVSATDATAITAAQSTFGVVTPADGAFDEPSELLVVRGDGRGWTAGPHPLRVRSRDAAGTWSAWREVSIVVARILRADGFEHGLAAWTTRGAVRPSRAAALVGRYGLDVRPSGRAAYLEDPSPIADRTLDVSLRLRATGLTGTVRLLELTDASRRAVAAIELRRGQIRAGGSWRKLPRGTVRITLRLARGRATLVLNGRAGSAVRAAGSVDALRVGAVRGGRGRLAIDQFTAVRG